jgi:hypothetical protein
MAELMSCTLLLWGIADEDQYKNIEKTLERVHGVDLSELTILPSGCSEIWVAEAYDGDMSANLQHALEACNVGYCWDTNQDIMHETHECIAGYRILWDPVSKRRFSHPIIDGKAHVDPEDDMAIQSARAANIIYRKGLETPFCRYKTAHEMVGLVAENPALQPYA